jgi:hypothetical protein
MGNISKGWQSSGVMTAGSGRPVNASVIGDANQDDNSSDDRLPGLSRNSLIGPDYATTNMRLSRRMDANRGLKLDLTGESFILFNRDNQRFQLTDDGSMSNAVRFQLDTKKLGISYFPAYYQVPAHLMRAQTPTAPRQLQFALRTGF